MGNGYSLTFHATLYFYIMRILITGAARPLSGGTFFPTVPVVEETESPEELRPGQVEPVQGAAQDQGFRLLLPDGTRLRKSVNDV
jgi:hypothetical protein